MNTENQNKPDQKLSGATQRHAKPRNNTAFWVVVMLWPPVALIVLAVLSLVVNLIGSTSTMAPRGFGTAGQVMNTTPGWVDIANGLILACVILALLGGVFNFSLGVFLLLKQRSKVSAFFDNFRNF